MQVPILNNNQPTVQQQALPDYRVQPVAPEAAFGGGVGKTISAIGGEYNEAAIKQKEQEDTDAVLNASNDMTNDMIDFTNGENGVFTRQGINAKGSADETEKFFNDSFEKYASTLSNPDQILAFREHMKPNVLNIMRDVKTYERNQNNAYSDQVDENSLKLNNQGVALNYTNPNTMNSFIAKNNQVIDARAQRKGWAPEVANATKIATNTEGIQSAVVAAMHEENYGAAGNILSTYKKVMDPTVYENLKFGLDKINRQNEDFVTADNIVKQATLPNGTIDRAKAAELLDNQLGPNSTKTIQGQPISYEQFKNNLFGQESGGNYDATNPRTGAYGKAQILPENWSSWAQDAGLPADAPQTPENQDLVIDAKLKPMYDKYGPIAAAVGWYAGEQNAERFAEGAPDAIGEGGHYSWDAKQGNGDEPSVREYAQSVVGSGETPDQTVSAFNANRYKAVQQLVDSKIRDATIAKNEHDKEYKRDLLNQLYAPGMSQTGAYAIIDNADPNVFDAKTKYELKLSLDRENKKVNTDPDATHFAAYKRNGGLQKDYLKTVEYWDRISKGEGDEITEKQQTAYDLAAYNYNLYQNYVSNGEFGRQQQQAQQDQAQQQYDQIMGEIWNSKTTQERANKANTYKDQLNQLGQTLDRDVNNDLTYILNNGQG